MINTKNNYINANKEELARDAEAYLVHLVLKSKEPKKVQEIQW